MTAWNRIFYYHIFVDIILVLHNRQIIGRMHKCFSLLHWEIVDCLFISLEALVALPCNMLLELSLIVHDMFTGMCLEKRVFYRAISGLHSSINIHLCSKYLLSGMCNYIGTDVSTWMFVEHLLLEPVACCLFHWRVL